MNKPIINCMLLLIIVLVDFGLADDLMPRTVVAQKFPPLAVQGRIAGSVVVKVSIDFTGRVNEVKVISGHPWLAKSAIEAAKQWKFVESSEKIRQVSLKFNYVILPEKSETEGETIFLPPYQVEIRKRPPPPTVNYK
jgi:TonB family protein